MIWSPFLIKIVLHHYACRSPHERADLPLYKEETKRLCDIGILLPNEFGYFDVTPKGEAMVKAWCETPIPVMKWIDPRFESKETGNGE